MLEKSFSLPAKLSLLLLAGDNLEDILAANNQKNRLTQSGFF